MPTDIKLKNSVTATNAPTSLQQGEVAINITDKKVWVGNAATTPVLLLGSGADGTFTNLTVSGVASFADGTVSLPSITNIGDTNTGIYFPAADTIAFTEGGVESMRIDSSGNVGIGTASPTAPLTFANTVGSAGAANKIRLLDNGSSIFGFGISASALDYRADNHVFYTIASSPTERMRISSGGNVGIGLSDPSFKLDVARGSSGVVLNLQGTDAYDAETGITLSTGRAKISGFLNTGGATPGTSLRFYTMPDSGSVTERMRIVSDGRILAGTTTSPANALLACNSGSNYWQYGASTTGSSIFWVLTSGGTGVSLTAGNTSWAAQSDERTKDIIEPITDALNKVSTLRAVIGKYKTDEEGTRRSFLIAQDVQKVLPEVVDTDTDEQGTMSIRYTETIPLLVAAIKEQQAIITQLQADVAALKGAK
jgi:hypothetical protein